MAAFFAGLPAMTASLKPFRAVIRAAFLAGTFTVAPVCGLRARRGPRCTRTNFAKPLRITGSPPATVSVIVVRSSSMKVSACFLSISSRSASSAASSRLFTTFSLVSGRPPDERPQHDRSQIVAQRAVTFAAIAQKTVKIPSHRPQATVNTILPKLSPSSMRANPARASARGRTESMTGRTPLASQKLTNR